MQPYPYLISKTIDPLFGIAVGVISYYAYEKRVGREEGRTLNELVMKRLGWQKEESEKK